MNRPLRILAVVTLALIAGCASRDNPYEREYIGIWYSQGQDPSLTWKLEDDGDFGRGEGYVKVDAEQGSWRVDRGELILTQRKDGKRVEERVKARVIGNTLTVDKDGKTLIFTRVGK